jgi:hypothetical protein
LWICFRVTPTAFAEKRSRLERFSVAPAQSYFAPILRRVIISSAEFLRICPVPDGNQGKVPDLFGGQKLEGRVMERRYVKHQIPFEERLASHARRLRDEAKKLRPGSDRDDLVRRARQAETASHLTEWLMSPGLASPK